MPGRTLRELHDLWRRAEPRGRVHRHIGQCMAGARRIGVERARGRDVFRRRHHGRISGSNANVERTRRGGCRIEERTMMSPVEIERRVHELGDWFQNLDLCGVPHRAQSLSRRLSEFQVAHLRARDSRRPERQDGARHRLQCRLLLARDEAPRRRPRGRDRFRRGAISRRPASPPRWTARDIEFRQLDVYDVAKLGERFDLVLFMGVLYHLRHPLLALDLLYEHVVGDTAGVSVADARQQRSRAARTGLPVLRKPRSSTSPAIR